MISLHAHMYLFVVTPPLQPPYDGPFRIIKHTGKFFVLDLNGKRDAVAIDRLKVAYLNDEWTPISSQPPIETVMPV